MSTARGELGGPLSLMGSGSESPLWDGVAAPEGGASFCLWQGILLDQILAWLL